MRPFTQTILLFALAVNAKDQLATPCAPLKLPWGTYDGTVGTDSGDNQICHYADVRFASPPTGSLRFAAPQYPPATTNGKAPPAPGKNMSCVQMTATSCLLGGPVGGSGPSCFPPKFGTEDEDCLFLDIWVPQKLMQPGVKLPVVVWIYGGAYTAGSKAQFDPSKVPFYDGDGIVSTATSQNKNTSVVFVAGNYRLGAYGWLAGSYIEKNGQPNAGLLDQRAVMQFVQDHISLVNGNPQDVSVWGESAGASSIMHHLAMPKNIKNPLFSKAILQSPAYQWMWNRTGILNDTFTLFAEYVSIISKDCSAMNMDCLRKASADSIKKANQAFAQVTACEGIMPFGPAVDGNLVPALAPVQFKRGKVAPLKSILVSHTDIEIPYANCTSDFSFLPKPIRCAPQSQGVMQLFLDEVFTGDAYKSIRDAILTKYPKDQFSDEIARAVSIITDVSFTCHTRFIINQYLAQKTPVYAMDYAVGKEVLGAVYNLSYHATDLIPLFTKKSTNYTDLITCLDKDIAGYASTINNIMHDDVSPQMQNFFANLAMNNNINANNMTTFKWSPASISGCSGPSDSNKCVKNMMVPSTASFAGVWFNNSATDLSTSDNVCNFWDKVAARISVISGAGMVEDLDGYGEQTVLSDEL